LVLGSKAISQENFILSDTILPSTRGFEKNPLQLANSLTDGKKTGIIIMLTWRQQVRLNQELTGSLNTNPVFVWTMRF